MPNKGCSKKRWLRLCEASEWWFNNFAKQAASDGWSTADIFGVCRTREGWGGLLDRMGNSRMLVMDRNRASWRDVFGNPDQFNRGSYPHLPAFWEANLEASSD
ncbi:hypothetical protein [Altererythrobacter sp. GH1-8]|uniref:hypothetical protein n=1 Tax=Altererythrobacter sp. GH1-8 TaxID=3349333 RepID=UPI00374CE0C9